MDFLYDENDRLYGFMLDKTAMYFYVRDALESILGIIDKIGNLVVQYAYNARGKIQSITGTLATTVGEHNPFRYKGYHFDSDTGMYYCHTRYYVPEWCRWLNGDSASFIDVNYVNGLNVFSYCENSPVLLTDRLGTSPRWINILAWIGVGLVVAAAIVLDSWGSRCCRWWSSWGGKGALAYDSPIIRAVDISVSQLFKAVLIGTLGGALSSALIEFMRWI